MTYLCFRLIDEERQSNVITETENDLPVYRKRSISGLQSDNIVGIYPTYDQVSTKFHSKCTVWGRESELGA